MTAHQDSRDYAQWIGKYEKRTDKLVAPSTRRLWATLDREDRSFETGDVLPPLAHWTYFLPNERQSDLGPDGHAMGGDFIPLIKDLPRRMWAGGRVEFRGDLRIGMAVERVSTITAVKQKIGTSGPLVFVTVQHVICASAAEPLLIEEQEIVYRSLGQAARPGQYQENAAIWSRSVLPDETMLFRYSALTFNSHRIHYDHEYATRNEGYPGLVVHGPLLATLLLDLANRHLPEARIVSFEFRAVAPVFVNQRIAIEGGAITNDTLPLWVTDQNNNLAAQATAKVRLL